MQPQVPQAFPSTAGLASNSPILPPLRSICPFLQRSATQTGAASWTSAGKHGSAQSSCPLCAISYIYAATGLVHVRHTGCTLGAHVRLCVHVCRPWLVPALLASCVMQAGLIRLSCYINVAAALLHCCNRLTCMPCIYMLTQGSPSPTCALQRAGLTHPVLPRWRRPLQRSCSGGARAGAG